MPQIIKKLDKNSIRQRYKTQSQRLRFQQNVGSRIVSSNIDITAKTNTGIIPDPVLFTKQIAAFLDQEKRRIACELHDDAGQMLTVISLRLRQLERHLPTESGRNAAIYAEVSEVCDIIERVQETLRNLAHSLYPAPLEHFSLPNALKSLLQECCAGSEISYQVIHTPDFPRLSMEIESNIYRIVQEAVTNSLKHAKANHITVLLTLVNRGLVVNIIDDGVGFALSNGKASNGLGMLSMRDRAMHIAAQLCIDASPGVGTHITLTVPLTDDNDAAE